jgi:hypothetical protein
MESPVSNILVVTVSAFQLRISDVDCGLKEGSNSYLRRLFCLSGRLQGYAGMIHQVLRLSLNPKPTIRNPQLKCPRLAKGAQRGYRRHPIPSVEEPDPTLTGPYIPEAIAFTDSDH